MIDYYSKFKPHFNEKEYEDIKKLIPLFRENGLVLNYGAGVFFGGEPESFFSMSTIGMKYEVDGKIYGDYCFVNNKDILSNPETIIAECKVRLKHH